ncbi:hypothetical protein N9515_02300 [Vicingaceae bacterium]|nr:hypothetical protein [Vicingaceae bacterium]MDB4060773.1 hypothetical protein [Vicingaceae bacterium]
MKNLFKTTLLFITIACGLYACTEDYFEFEKIKIDDWNPNFAVPLISSNLSLADIVVRQDTNGDIFTTANGGLEIVYRSSVLSSDTSTVINIPTENFADTFTVSQATNGLLDSMPAGPPFNNGQRIDFDASTQKKIIDNSRFGIVVDSMTLKTGTLAFRLENSFPYDLTIAAKFRTFTDSLGDTLVLNYVVPAAKPNNQVSLQVVDLKGYQVNLSEDEDGNPADNLLPIDIQYSIQLESGVASNRDDKLTMTGAITNINFKEFYGSLGSTPLPLESDSIAIAFFKNFQEFAKEDLFISNPTLRLTAKNSFSCPMNFEFTKLNAVNPNRNPSVIPFDIPTELQPLNIYFPDKYGVAQTVFELNNVNSNLDTILSHLTKSIAFDSEALFNPNGEPPRNGQRRNFMTDTSDLGLDLEFRIPFEGRANGFFIEDTINVTLEQIGDLTDGTLRIYAENGFPMDVDLQLTFLDSFNVELGKLILPSNPIYSNGFGMILPSAPTKLISSDLEADGFTTNITDTKIDRERLKRISRTAKVAISAKLSTEGANMGTNVVFNSANRLKIIISLNSLVSFN